jgi:AraC-like DNA-binding protein
MKYLFCPFEPGLVADNCGNAMLSPGWSHPARNLPSSVLIFGRKGLAYIQEEDAVFELVPDRLILLTARRRHWGQRPIDLPASYYWIHFTQQKSFPLLTEAEAFPILNNPAVLKERLGNAALIPQQIDFPSPEPIDILFRELLHEQERPSYCGRKYQLLFQNLLISTTEAAISSFRPMKDTSTGVSIVYSVISEITSNMTDPNLSIKSIAKRLDHNADYIGRLFKEIMGFPVGEYVAKKRIELAVSLLQEGYEPVSAISEKCGFSSIRHFLRQFKRLQGMTPSELRHRYNAIHVNNH